MKGLILLLSYAVLTQALLEFPIHQRNSKSTGVAHMSEEKDDSLYRYKDMDLCPTCYEFGLQAVADLWNFVLHDLHDQPTPCTKICADVTNKTHSNNTGLFCNLFCNYAGNDTFIKAIMDSTANSLYFCEGLGVCPISDKGDAKITNLTVHPRKGPKGTTFMIDLEYVTSNGTGSGLIFILIQTVDNVLAGDVILNEMKAPGLYGNKIPIKAEPDPNCNPKTSPAGCEKWLPGVYIVDLFLCNGDCTGGSDPHQKIYSQGKANFTITG